MFVNDSIYLFVGTNLTFSPSPYKAASNYHVTECYSSLVEQMVGTASEDSKYDFSFRRRQEILFVDTSALSSVKYKHPCQLLFNSDK